MIFVLRGLDPSWHWELYQINPGMLMVLSVLRENSGVSGCVIVNEVFILEVPIG